MGKRILGIDLGTTNTCVAVMEAGQPVIISNSAGARTTPSVVAYTEDGEVLVGQPARRQSVVNPTRTIHSIKRLMGQTLDAFEVQELRPHLGYTLGENEQGQLIVEGGVRERTPIEVSATILRTIRTAAEEYFSEQIIDAVITCPAYFNDAQRQATHDAGRIAGMNVARIINEPTAAALAYGWNHSVDGTLVVFDWGGGTFDCTVLECADGVFNVKSTNGNPYLGGNDIDTLVQALLLARFKEEHGVEVNDDAVAMQRLREAAETAKVELSSTTQTDIMLPFLVTDDDGPKHLEMSLSRKEFEEVIEDLVDTTLKGCQQALDDAGIKTDEVQTLLIVGGTTKIPYVQERLSDFFGQAPRKGVNPDEAIAMGAAIQAGIIGGGVEDVLLIDILPLSLGIAEGPKFAPILFRNSQIPTYRCDSFETRRDHQNSVLIKVYQGEHMEVTKNKLIGLFRMDGLPPAPAGMIKFDVTFRVDENGLLQVEVLEKGTGRSRELICPNTMRLSEAEIQKYKKQLDFDE